MKKIILRLLFIAVFAACSGNSEEEDTYNIEEPKKSILKKLVLREGDKEIDASMLGFSFYYTGTSLDSMVDEVSRHTYHMKYEGDVISEIHLDKGYDPVNVYKYQYDDKNRLVSSEYYVYGLIEKTKVVYNSNYNGLMAVYDGNDNLSQEIEYEFDSKGNIISKFIKGSDYNLKFFYEDKLSPFQNIQGFAEVFKFRNEYYSNSVKSMTSYNGSTQYNFTNTFNDDGSLDKSIQVIDESGIAHTSFKYYYYDQN